MAKTVLLGYARVSTESQNLDAQRDALQAAGCEVIYEEQVSSAASERPQLDAALKAIRKGDVLVVARLDRLGRSLPHLVTTVESLEEREIGFKSLAENIDTSTAGGRLIFHVFSALADFERALIRERTKAGLAAARARGRVGGRPKKLSNQQLKMAEKLLSDCTLAEVAAQFGVDRSTLSRRLKTLRDGATT